MLVQHMQSYKGVQRQTCGGLCSTRARPPKPGYEYSVWALSTEAQSTNFVSFLSAIAKEHCHPTHPQVTEEGIPHGLEITRWVKCVGNQKVCLSGFKTLGG